MDFADQSIDCSNKWVAFAGGSGDNAACFQ
jgi:hypothetical protein